jgi:hypothetical protein
MIDRRLARPTGVDLRGSVVRHLQQALPRW